MSRAQDARQPVAGWPKLPLPWTSDVPVVGPRRWWPGPLDVEGLAVAAVAAVGAAAAAANALAIARSSPWRCSMASGHVGAAFGSIDRLRIDGEQPEGWQGELSGFFRTADGWIRLHANYPHHARALGEALRIRNRTELAATVAHTDMLELEARVRAAGGIAGAVRTPQQWLDHPQQRSAVQDRPLVDLDVATGAVRPLAPSPSLPMHGIRVLDLTRVISGPTASRLLAALGADVLRVDPPARPELIDQHLDTGFGKRTAELELTDPDRLADLEDLVASADVVLSGYRPGALASFGFDRSELSARHPHLIVIELSAFGDDGPWGGDRGFDSIVQAVNGIAATYADADGTPGALPVQALDHATGYLIAAAVMRLLARRGVEGGAGARLALARTGQWLLGTRAAEVSMDSDAFDGPACPLWLANAESPYGSMQYVRPPLMVEGVPMDYPAPPRAYGRDAVEWWDERE